MDNTAAEVKSQANASKIPINSTLSFNNDANDDKQTNTFNNARIKHSPPPKKYVCHILI